MVIAWALIIVFACHVNGFCSKLLSSSLGVVRPATTAAAVAQPSTTDMGAYIHIPFCRRRCYYCSFPIQVVGERESTQRLAGEEYTQLLLQEVDLFADMWRRSAHNAPPLDTFRLKTLYFGGGTPSLLPDSCLETLIQKMQATFGLSPDAEVTLEMDPGTFDLPRLQRLIGLGVNRVSIGVQAFDEASLRACGRAHSAEDVLKALDALSRSALRSYSMDLISALPGVSVETWQSTLETALSYHPPHISVYDLQIEDRTAFGKWFKPGLHPLPSEAASCEMLTMASERLRAAGYDHYELSNYALQDHRSQHNQRYWGCKETLGVGLGAASYVGRSRFTRPASMQEYKEWLQAADVGDQYLTASLLGSHSSGLDAGPDLLEFVMLALRTANGLNLAETAHLFGQNVSDAIQSSLLPYAEWALVEFADGRVRVTDPKGFLLSNGIISSVFSVLPER